VKIFITGIAGFLGSELERFWKAAGNTVAGTTRSGPAISPAGFDIIVHAAYDSKAGVERNVTATKAMHAEAVSAGVPYQLFLSSYAARRESQAEYGRMKYQLETFFLENGHAAVRPGLVIGNGGMFGRNLKQILRSPVIPLLDGGRDPIPVIAIEDFVQAMDAIVGERKSGAFNLFNSELVPMKEMVRTIKRVAGQRAFLVPIPVGLALTLLKTMEKLKIPFPAAADNVRSLKQSLPRIFESDLEQFVPRPRSFDSMIRSLSDRSRNTDFSLS
jgi:uncharacterized protein YbjT (DUF2867 family)